MVCLLPVHKLEVAAVFNLGSGSRTGVLGMYKHNFNFLIFLSAQAQKGQNSSSAGTGRASLSETRSSYQQGIRRKLWRICAR